MSRDQRIAQAFAEASDKQGHLSKLGKGELVILARQHRISETVATGPDLSRNRRTKRKDELAAEILAASERT